MRSILTLCICFTLLLKLDGQTLDTMYSLDQFIARVVKHHPMTFQANLLKDNAAVTRMLAKGSFDPKLQGSFDQKSYDDKNYYRRIGGGLKVPTWFGADLSAKYKYTDGEFLNNDEQLPPNGLWSLGISIPLGKGLIIDERRAEVKKADLFLKATEQEQKILINELIFNAHQAYLDWQMAAEQFKIEKEGVEIAEIRFSNTKKSNLQGDVPAIDTLESLITLQDRRQRLQSAIQNLENKKINLQNFLWMEGYVPLEFENDFLPEPLQNSVFSTQMDSISLVKDQMVSRLPILMTYEIKLQSLAVDESLNRENLKPELNIGFNPLIGSTDENAFRTYDANDYTVGATFSMPLFLRKERAKLEMTRIKIDQAKIDLALKRQDLMVKLGVYENNASQIQNQLNILEENQERYLTLLEAENRKYRIGESSIFLINSREIKYLESRLKVINYQSKLIKTRLIYLFLMNQFVS